MMGYLRSGVSVMLVLLLIAALVPMVSAQCALGARLCYKPGSHCGSNGKSAGSSPVCPSVLPQNNCGVVEESSSTCQLSNIRGCYANVIPNQPSAEGWYLVNGWCGEEQASSWAFCLDYDQNPQEFCNAGCTGKQVEYKAGSECCGDDDECMDISGSALCTQVQQDVWKVIDEENTGQIYRSSCGSELTFLVGNDQYYYCGGLYEGSSSLVTPLSGIVATVTKTSVGFGGTTTLTHDFVCYEATPDVWVIAECRGDDPSMAGSEQYEVRAPYSTTLTTGQSIDTVSGFDDDTFYCTSDGKWTRDLDFTDIDSCGKAGFDWTGTRCCSEADDADEYYGEFFPEPPIQHIIENGAPEVVE